MIRRYVFLVLSALNLLAFPNVSIGEMKPEEMNQFVQQCLRDFESIKVGMTRAEVEKQFPMDGGLQGVSPVRYLHPKCSYFKVNVEFDFKRNSKEQNRAVFRKEDKVISVSKPYIEWPNHG